MTPTTIATLAGIVAAGLLAAIAAFQAALAMGAPLGNLVWGGTHEGQLPPHYRLASAGATIVLAAAALLVMAQAGLVNRNPLPTNLLEIAVWALAIFMIVNTAGNIASQSSFERFVFAPTTALLAVLTAIVAWVGSGPA